MPLCVNRTFFTAWFLTSAAAGGGGPSPGPGACSVPGRASRRDVHSPGQGAPFKSASKSSVKTFWVD